MRYSHAATLFYNVPLALLPSKAHEIHAFWTSKLADAALAWEDKAEPFAVRYYAARQADEGEIDDLDLLGEVDEEQGVKRTGAVAVIPIYGTISQRMNMFSAMSGGTSTQQLTQAFRAALADDDVAAIVFDIDSPGGSSYGVAELAAEILQARGRKPMLSVANSVEASAAYWIGAMADYNYSTPGGLVGSVGVYAMHQDVSGHMANEGVKTTFIQAGKNKTRGNPYEPLSREDTDYIQELVDDTEDQFLHALAAGRRTSVKTVRERYGEGDVLTPKAALAAGMIDGIKTLDEVISIALRARPRKPSALRSAAATPPAVADAGDNSDSAATEPPIDRHEEQDREDGRRRLGLMRLHELAARS